MFKLLKSSDDLITYINETWAREENNSPYTNNTYCKPYKYPCLGTAVLNYSNRGDRPRFMCIYCYKNEAKRIVYPSTNKDRSANRFRFAENKDALWELIDSNFRAAGMVNNRTQSSIFDEVHRICSTNDAFPVLYTCVNVTLNEGTKLFKPMVLSCYTAKELIYFRPLKKSKIVVAPSLSQEMIHIQSAAQGPATPNTRRGGIVVDLSANAPGIIRFTNSTEYHFLSSEEHKLKKMNIELDRDLEDVRDDDRYNYVKGSLSAFSEWRRAQRRTYAMRFPHEVLTDSANQSLLLGLTATE